MAVLLSAPLIVRVPPAEPESQVQVPPLTARDASVFAPVLMPVWVKLPEVTVMSAVIKSRAKAVTAPPETVKAALLPS